MDQEIKQVKICCKLCKDSILVTDTSKKAHEIGGILGNLILQHLKEKHKECAENVEKRCIEITREIFSEYITPDFEGIADIYGM